MTVSRLQRVQQVLARRQPDVAVVLDEVHKPHNLSAIIRTCDAVGVPDVYAVANQAGLKALSGTAKGSDRWVSLNIHKTIDDAVTLLKQYNMAIYAAHLSDRAVDFREADFTKPCAVIMGAERDGVGARAAELADQHIVIPMLGMVESLNVSVATAVILYELQRQREAAGFYDQCHYDETVQKKMLFEWLQPKLARYCQDKKIPYPELDEEGDIVEPAKWLKCQK